MDPCPSCRTSTQKVFGTGSNIISSRGDEWRHYRAIIKPGLQAYFDANPILENAERLVIIFGHPRGLSPTGGIMVQGILHRYSSANLLYCVFDCPKLSVSEALRRAFLPL